MPVKHGIEATREILQINEDAKIIVASADDSVKESATKLGVIIFKTKPFTNEKLINNIKKALHSNYQIIK